MKSNHISIPIGILFTVLLFPAGDIFLSAQGTAEIPRLTAKATGTGRTTGHIITLSVQNSGDESFETLAQTVYIPSDGKYQPYIGRIQSHSIIPPGSTIDIPIHGYCVDVHRPPCPAGISLPPISDWIPVGDPTWLGEAVPPTEWAYPVPSAKQPGDVLMASPEYEELVIRLRPRKPAVLITTPPVPDFHPGAIPDIKTSAGFEPVPEQVPVQVTWPGTDDPLGGTIDPDADPRVFAGLIAGALDRIEEAYDDLHGEGAVQTPFSATPDKERESVIQQTFWIYTAAVTGQEYTRVDFTSRVHAQYADNSGKPVSALPPEERKELDAGVDEFWSTFAATGVEAKVISADSPGLGVSPEVLASVTTPSCKCKKITYRLEVTRGGRVVHAEDHETPTNPKVLIDDFKFGDELDIKILNIRPDCSCGENACRFYPAKSTNSNSPDYTEPDLTRVDQTDIEMANDEAGAISENSNCTNEGKTWSDDGAEYSFTLKTKDEGTTSRGVHQRLRIKSYCMLDGCRKALCAKYITLQFGTKTK